MGLHYDASSLKQGSIQSLAAGENDAATDSLTETFTIRSLDGTASQDVIIVIQGANDAASIAGTQSGAVTEDGALSLSPGQATTGRRLTRVISVGVTSACRATTSTPAARASRSPRA